MDEVQKAVLLLVLGGVLTIAGGAVSNIFVHRLTLQRELAIDAQRSKRQHEEKAQEQYREALAATLQWADTIGSILTHLHILFGMYRKLRPSESEFLPFLREAAQPPGVQMHVPPGHQLALLRKEQYQPLFDTQTVLVTLVYFATNNRETFNIAEQENSVDQASEHVRNVNEQLQAEYRQSLN